MCYKQTIYNCCETEKKILNSVSLSFVFGLNLIRIYLIGKGIIEYNATGVIVEKIQFIYFILI